MGADDIYEPQYCELRDELKAGRKSSTETSYKHSLNCTHESYCERE